MHDFDSMLVHVGEFGRYQKLLVIFQAPFCMFLTFVLLGSLFMTNFPREFYCADRFNCSELNHLTAGQKQNLSFPYVNGRVDPRFITDLNISFLQEISEGQNWAEKNFCKDYFNRDKNQNRSSCIHVYNGTYWLTQSLDSASYNNYQTFSLYNTDSNLARNDTAPQYGSSNIGVVFAKTVTNRNEHSSHGTDNSTNYQINSHQNLTSSSTSTFKRSVIVSNVDSGQRSDKRNSRKIENKNTQRQVQWHNNCDKRILSRIHIKNTTRLTLEKITMSKNGRRTTLEQTYTRRDGNQNTCREIGWDRITPGNTARYYPTIITEGNHWGSFQRIRIGSQAIFFIGSIFGAIIFGWMADTWGRVPTLAIVNLVGAIGGALSVTTTNFWLFSFFRFITGMSFDNCFVMIYILVLEFCGPRYRTFVANSSTAIFQTLGPIILPWLALYLENWRTFGLAISLPMLLGLLAIFIVPESSRWLISKGETQRATNILRRFAKVNGKNVDEKIFVDFEEGAQKLYEKISSQKHPSIFEAFKKPRLRMKFVLLILQWSTIVIALDGHSRNIMNLANAEWNIYWLFTIASLTRFPAGIMLIFTLDIFGRRWSSFITLIFSGVCSLIAALVPRDQWATSLIMAMISRFWINMSLSIGLQYTSELLPTVIRAQGVNVIHIVGFVAQMSAPFIAGIGRTQPALSLLLLGAVALFGGVISLFLPETMGEDLPNNLEEAEVFGKHQSFWNCPILVKLKKSFNHSTSGHLPTIATPPPGNNDFEKRTQKSECILDKDCTVAKKCCKIGCGIMLCRNNTNNV